MIKATFYKDSEKGSFFGFNVKGHSGYAESGSDIVCASVSSMVMLFVNTADGALSLPFDFQSDEEAAMVDFKFKEINEMAKWEGKELNAAKKRLAYEVTKLVHGEDEANKVKAAAEAVFGGGMNSADMPTTEIEKAELSEGMSILDVLVKASLAASKGEARRLIQQGGVLIADVKADSLEAVIEESAIGENGLIVKKGKKIFNRIVVK